MILRIFRVVINPDRREEFETFFRDTALPLVLGQPGIVSATAGTPSPEAPDEYCMVMVWKDIESLAAFAGEAWQKPHIHPDEEGIVLDRFLSHYDVVKS